MTKVLTPQALRCPVTNKAAYPSESRAMAVAERSHVNATWHGEPVREAYQCRHCNWWHVTKGRRNRG